MFKDSLLKSSQDLKKIKQKKSRQVHHMEHYFLLILVKKRGYAFRFIFSKSLFALHSND